MSIKHSWEGDAEYVQGQTVLKTCNDQIVPSNDAKNYQSGTMVGTSKFVIELCLEHVFIISYFSPFTSLFTPGRLLSCLLLTSHFSHSFLTLPSFLSSFQWTRQRHFCSLMMCSGRRVILNGPPDGTPTS